MSDVRWTAGWGEELRQIVAGPEMLESGFDPAEHRVLGQPGLDGLGSLQRVTPACSHAFLGELFSECGD
jgi:hypothetical protein